MAALEATLVAPLVEEIIFRGLLFTAFEKIARPLIVVGATATLFLAIHLIQFWGDLQALTVTFTLGLVTGWLRAWTGSLWPGWVVHTVNNLIVSITLLRF